MIGLENQNKKASLELVFCVGKLLLKEKKESMHQQIQKRKDIADIKSNKDAGIIGTKEELRKAKDTWNEHVAKIKKKKDDDVLDLKDNLFEDDNENHKKHKEKVLKSLKKKLRRNNEFRYLACNSGKGQKNGSSRM